MVDILLKANKDDHVVLFNLHNLLISELPFVTSSSTVKCNLIIIIF